jgi:hypothetical protein
MWDGDFQLSTSKRCVHKTLPPESLQSSDSIEASEAGSFVHKTDVCGTRFNMPRLDAPFSHE